MLILLSWLKDYLDFDLSDENLSNTLTLAGLEVDKIEKTPLSFTGVVVAQVLEVTPHPEADKLKIAHVTDGEATYQVVCGAQNCRKDLLTAFAKVGATLTDEEGKTIKIKKSKLRGVESFGMLCSGDELGLSTSSEGILELAPSFKIGFSLASFYEETCIEISLTPNLGHCTSVRGVARELACILNKKMKHPYLTPSSPTLSIYDKISISIENDKLCPRYCAKYLENVEVKPSPDWLKNRLELSGIKSVNNIVDVTNYVMLAIGQPMHAFDYDKIEGQQLNIKTCENEETFLALDHVERTIPKETLLIYDEQKPLAVAGVIGGYHSEITNTTTRLLLESAYFHPSKVRQASKQLNLRTQASSRFEKYTDPNSPCEALDLASELIKTLCPQAIISDTLDEKLRPFPKKKLTLRLSRLNNLLGTTLSLGDVENIFSSLDFSPQVDEQNQIFHVHIPTYRNDIAAEIDLIEEIARIYGYNNITYQEKKCSVSTLNHCPLYLSEQIIKNKLIAQGLQECITCNLISPKLADLGYSHRYSENPLIEVMHPSSVDQSILRPSLLPSLLQMIKHNFDHQTFSIASFEVGQVHFKKDHKLQEKTSVGLILTGAQSPQFWGEKGQDFDFYDLKGLLDNLFLGLHLDQVSYRKSPLEGFHPGRKAIIETPHHFLGVVGEVHPALLQKIDIHQKVYFAELELQELIKALPQSIQMKPLPEFPGSERDWTETFDRSISAAKILQTLKKIPSRLLKQVTLLDLYTSEKLGADKKNLTFRFFYRDDKKTVEYEAVEKEHHRILSLARSHLF